MFSTHICDKLDMRSLSFQTKAMRVLLTHISLSLNELCTSPASPGQQLPSTSTHKHIRHPCTPTHVGLPRPSDADTPTHKHFKHVHRTFISTHPSSDLCLRQATRLPPSSAHIHTLAHTLTQTLSMICKACGVPPTKQPCLVQSGCGQSSMPHTKQLWSVQHASHKAAVPGSQTGTCSG
eukprot:1152745-Pelagomonas_calceolata.AAC.2